MEEQVGLALERSYFEWACLTAQQTAEKAAKALGMHEGLSIRGHAVSVIMRALKEHVEIPEELISLVQVLDA